MKIIDLIERGLFDNRGSLLQTCDIDDCVEDAKIFMTIGLDIYFLCKEHTKQYNNLFHFKHDTKHKKEYYDNYTNKTKNL